MRAHESSWATFPCALSDLSETGNQKNGTHTFFSASPRSLSSSWRWWAWTQIVSRLSAFILSITLCWSIPRFVSLNRESLRCCNSSAREECSFLQIINIYNERRMALYNVKTMGLSKFHLILRVWRSLFLFSGYLRLAVSIFSRLRKSWNTDLFALFSIYNLK